MYYPKKYCNSNQKNIVSSIVQRNSGDLPSVLKSIVAIDLLFMIINVVQIVHGK